MLITGASGWIGGRLLTRLVNTGVRVRAASRLKRQWPSGVDGIVATTDRFSSVEAACEGIDVLINLAAMSELMSRDEPEAALHATSVGTARWAAAAASARVHRFVQVSTSKVYGSELSGAVTESTPVDPRSPYAIAHYAAERYALLRHPDTIVLRIANAFGPPACPSDTAWQSIVNDFCRQAVGSRRITINSSGLSWRNIVPMPDVVQGIEVAMTAEIGGVYNLGSRTALPLRDIAHLVAQSCSLALGYEPEVVWREPSRPESHSPLDYRIDRLVAAGYDPRVPVQDEIRETLKAAR